MYFAIIAPESTPGFAAPADNPLPIQAGNRKLFSAIPRQWVSPPLLDVRQRYVAAVANDMDDERVRNLPFDLPDIEKVIRGAIGPAGCALETSRLLHHNAQEVTRTSAFRQDLVANVVLIETGDLEKLAFEPVAQEFAAIPLPSQISETGLENAEHVRFGAVNGKIACREQHVIEQRSPGAWAAQHEHGCFRSHARIHGRGE